MCDQAWVTLATNDSYSLGAMVLGTSLRRVNTTRQLVVMVTPGVSPRMRAVLESLFNLIEEVIIWPNSVPNGASHLLSLIVGDLFNSQNVLQNCDELFDREEFSAAKETDPNWHDCFNSGVYVFKPSLKTLASLIEVAAECGPFDGYKGLLNSFFGDWSVSDISRRLSFIYNMAASPAVHLPANRVSWQSVKIARFIGSAKPWLQQLDTERGQVRPPVGQDHLKELLQAWWDILRADIYLRLQAESDLRVKLIEEMQNLRKLKENNLNLKNILSKMS